MKPVRRWIAALTLLGGAVLAATAAPFQPDVTRTSRPVRLLRSWEDTVKGKNGAEYTRRVDLLFDYGRGIAREEYRAADGTPLGWRDIKQNQPAPSPEEIAEATKLILADAELARLVSRRSARFNGGFVLEEARGRPCGPGTRCIQLQVLSSDQRGLLRWTVVDLVGRKLAYRVYLPGKAVNP